MTATTPPPSGEIRDGRHWLPVRVYWENTDAGGIVYHSEYLKFAERARTEYLRLVGVHQSALLEAEGIAFAVASLSIDYKRPATLDDALVVESELAELGAASLLMLQTIHRGMDTVIARLRVKVACLSLRSGGPVRLPASIRSRLVLPPGTHAVSVPRTEPTPSTD